MRSDLSKAIDATLLIDTAASLFQRTDSMRPKPTDEGHYCCETVTVDALNA